MNKFDESEHPRDNDGKFTEKGETSAKAQTKIAEDFFDGDKEQFEENFFEEIPKEGLTSNAGSGIINIGRTSGALDPNSKSATKHAKLFYEEIRKRKADIQSISKNTGFQSADIKKVKDHMFYNEYELYGVKKRFDPEFEQAVSWQRLTEGKDIWESDIVLLKHELMEYDLMNNKGMSYNEAHELSNKKYNYKNVLDREKMKNGKIKT